ncbi:MAG TPA: hypothetical protein VML96_09255 [Egibacteraceae bacterium]|nr:hypothetical protein [Egibacteraceae bacterium]
MSRPVRVAVVAAALVAAVALLFLVVFPWVDRNFLADPVLGSGGRVFEAALGSGA